VRFADGRVSRALGANFESNQILTRYAGEGGRAVMSARYRRTKDSETLIVANKCGGCAPVAASRAQ
jgi:hypothetical protein